MTEDQAKTLQWNPFDLTKVWPHSDYPLMEIGILELNRNPETYFVEVEQAAFSPSPLVWREVVTNFCRPALVFHRAQRVPRQIPNSKTPVIKAPKFHFTELLSKSIR